MNRWRSIDVLVNSAFKLCDIVIQYKSMQLSEMDTLPCSTSYNVLENTNHN